MTIYSGDGRGLIQLLYNDSYSWIYYSVSLYVADATAAAAAAT